MAKNYDGLTQGQFNATIETPNGSPQVLAEVVRGGGMIVVSNDSDRDLIDGRVLENRMIIWHAGNNSYQYYDASAVTRDSSGFLNGGEWKTLSFSPDFGFGLKTDTDAEGNVINVSVDTENATNPGKAIATHEYVDGNIIEFGNWRSILQSAFTNMWTVSGNDSDELLAQRFFPVQVGPGDYLVTTLESRVDTEVIDNNLAFLRFTLENDPNNVFGLINHRSVYTVTSVHHQGTHIEFRLEFHNDSSDTDIIGHVIGNSLVDTDSPEFEIEGRNSVSLNSQLFTGSHSGLVTASNFGVEGYVNGNNEWHALQSTSSVVVDFDEVNNNTSFSVDTDWLADHVDMNITIGGLTNVAPGADDPQLRPPTHGLDKRHLIFDQTTNLWTAAREVVVIDATAGRSDETTIGDIEIDSTGSFLIDYHSIPFTIPLNRFIDVDTDTDSLSNITYDTASDNLIFNSEIGIGRLNILFEEMNWSTRIIRSSGSQGIVYFAEQQPSYEIRYPTDTDWTILSGASIDTTAIVDGTGPYGVFGNQYDTELVDVPPGTRFRVRGYIYYTPPPINVQLPQDSDRFEVTIAPTCTMSVDGSFGQDIALAADEVDRRRESERGFLIYKDASNSNIPSRWVSSRLIEEFDDTDNGAVKSFVSDDTDTKTNIIAGATPSSGESIIQATPIVWTGGRESSQSFVYNEAFNAYEYVGVIDTEVQVTTTNTTINAVDALSSRTNNQAGSTVRVRLAAQESRDGGLTFSSFATGTETTIAEAGALNPGVWSDSEQLLHAIAEQNSPRIARYGYMYRVVLEIIFTDRQYTTITLQLSHQNHDNSRLFTMFITGQYHILAGGFATQEYVSAQINDLVDDSADNFGLTEINNRLAVDSDVIADTEWVKEFHNGAYANELDYALLNSTVPAYANSVGVNPGQAYLNQNTNGHTLIFVGEPHDEQLHHKFIKVTDSETGDYSIYRIKYTNDFHNGNATEFVCEASPTYNSGANDVDENATFFIIEANGNESFSLGYGLDHGNAGAIKVDTDEIANRTYVEDYVAEHSGVITDTDISSGFGTNVSSTMQAGKTHTVINVDTDVIADTDYVNAKINELIGGAPGTLDTLNEIAEALNDDSDAFVTLMNRDITAASFDTDNDTLTLTRQAGDVTVVIPSVTESFVNNQFGYQNLFTDATELRRYPTTHDAGHEHFASVGSDIRWYDSQETAFNSNLPVGSTIRVTFVDTDPFTLDSVGYYSISSTAYDGLDELHSISLEHIEGDNPLSSNADALDTENHYTFEFSYENRAAGRSFNGTRTGYVVPGGNHADRFLNAQGDFTVLDNTNIDTDKIADTDWVKTTIAPKFDTDNLGISSNFDADTLDGTLNISLTDLTDPLINNNYTSYAMFRNLNTGTVRFNADNRELYVDTDGTLATRDYVLEHAGGSHVNNLIYEGNDGATEIVTRLKELSDGRIELTNINSEFAGTGTDKFNVVSLADSIGELALIISGTSSATNPLDTDGTVYTIVTDTYTVEISGAPNNIGGLPQTNQTIFEWNTYTVVSGNGEDSRDKTVGQNTLVSVHDGKVDNVIADTEWIKNHVANNQVEYLAGDGLNLTDNTFSVNRGDGLVYRGSDDDLTVDDNEFATHTYVQSAIHQATFPTEFDGDRNDADTLYTTVVEDDRLRIEQDRGITGNRSFIYDNRGTTVYQGIALRETDLLVHQTRPDADPSTPVANSSDNWSAHAYNVYRTNSNSGDPLYTSHAFRYDGHTSTNFFFNSSGNLHVTFDRNGHNAGSNYQLTCRVQLWITDSLDKMRLKDPGTLVSNSNEFVVDFDAGSPSVIDGVSLPSVDSESGHIIQPGQFVAMRWAIHVDHYDTNGVSEGDSPFLVLARESNTQTVNAGDCEPTTLSHSLFIGTDGEVLYKNYNTNPDSVYRLFDTDGQIPHLKVNAGFPAEALGNEAIALGGSSQANDSEAIAIGFEATAGNESAIAIGAGANTGSHNHSIALGKNAATTHFHQLVIGGTANADRIDRITTPGFTAPANSTPHHIIVDTDGNWDVMSQQDDAGNGNLVAGTGLTYGDSVEFTANLATASSSNLAVDTEIIAKQTDIAGHFDVDTLDTSVVFDSALGTLSYGLIDETAGTPGTHFASRALVTGLHEGSIRMDSSLNLFVDTDIIADTDWVKALPANATVDSTFGDGVSNASAPGTNSVAVGGDAQATGNNAAAIGRANADTDFATAIGYNSGGYGGSPMGYRSTGIGAFARTAGDNSVAIGVSAQSDGSNSFAMGRFANSDGDHAIAIGRGSEAEGDYSIAIGSATNGDTESSSMATGVDSIAIGRNAMALHNSSVAIGRGSTTNESNQMSFAGGQLSHLVLPTAGSDPAGAPNGSMYVRISDGVVRVRSGGNWVSIT